LTGEIRPIKSVLAMALQAAEEMRDGLLVPTANAPEVAVVENLNVIPVASLAEAVGFLSGQLDIVPQSADLRLIASPRLENSSPELSARPKI
jgi:magnesium chelatase family protein